MIPVEINKAFLEAAQKHGFPLLDDPYGGNVSGPWCFAQRVVSTHRELPAAAR